MRTRRSTRGLGRYVGNRWSEEALPVNCYLLERPDALLLFDTGQSALAARAGHLPRWHPYLRLARFELTPNQEAQAQVRGLGYDPSDVRTVVLSHLHTDHIGGLASFEHAEVLVTRLEWERATRLRGRLRGYTPGHWPPRIRPQLREFGPAPGTPFAGSTDLADDDELMLVHLPGHTAGHAGLLVSDGGRRWLLAGDAAHAAAELAELAPALDAWAKREGVIVLTAHDPAARELLRQHSDTARRPVS